MQGILPESIRRRILLFVLLLLASISTLIGIASFRDASHEIEEIFDARLAQNARLLQALILGVHESDLGQKEKTRLQQSFEDALVRASQSSDGHKYESKIAYQVWQGGQLILRSTSAPQPFEHLGHGFGSVFFKGYQWITFTLKTESQGFPVIVTVAEREDVRGELVHKVVLQTLVPELVGIPLLGALIWLAIGWGLSPLKELTNQIKDKKPNNLKPVQLNRPPTELIPIQNALNQLLEETQTMISREQRFIADAAHELRTPLTVLKIHTDNALSHQSDEERETALRELNLGVDRTARIVSQLLTLARLDPGTLTTYKREQDLLKECRNSLAGLMPLAWSKKIELSLEADKDLNWKAPLEEEALEVMLQNLISNSVKFSPCKSTIEVILEQSHNTFIISVQDHGQGIPEENFCRAAERFYREGSMAGAGLGLSIVKRIAERHSGYLELKETLDGGLTATVYLPKASSC